MISGRRLLSIGLVASGILCFPPQAQAHSPIEGIGIFYGYMLHTLVVPAHALLLVATTLMLGRQGLGGARIGLTVLAAGFVAGLAISNAGLAGASEWQLLVGALAVAGIVSLGRQVLMIALVPAAAAAGLAIGLDSAPSEAADGEKSLAFAGLISGTLGLALVVTGLTIGLTREWQHIGVRIVGSWILAVSILVLSLSLTGDATVDGRAPIQAQGRPA